MSLQEQVKEAQKTIRMLKDVSPQIFPEYSRLQTAKYELKKAQKEYTEANQAWYDLGWIPFDGGGK